MKNLSFFKRLTVLVLLACCLFACERKTKEQLLHDGIELQQSNNPTGAIVMFKNALEKDPNYYEARLQLGVAYLSWGNYIQAEKELEKVLLQDPQNGEVLLHLATVHLKNRTPDRAIARVERYLQEQPVSAEAYELLGSSFTQKGEMAKAEQAYKKAIELDDQQIAARNGLARLYGASSRLGQARSLLQENLVLDGHNKDTYYLLLQVERMAGNPEEAMDVARRLLELFPAEVKAAYLLGILELQRNDLAAARELADNLLAHHADHPAGIRLQGLILFAEEKYAEAADKLQQSLKKFPDLTGRYMLGLSHYKLGAFELALNQFQAMLDEKPDHHQARLMVAQTLFRQKRFDDSRTAAQMVLKAQPNNALAHDILGSVYLAQGDFDRGMEELDRAIELAPQLVDAQLKKGLFNLSQGKLQQAEGPLEEVVRLAPELLNSRLLLAASYLKRQNYGEAIATLEKGLQGRPEDAVLHNHLSAAYLGQGQAEAAVAELEKAKKCKPDYAAPYVNLANYYLSQGQPDKAAAEYSALLQVVPKNLRALLSLAALQEIQGNAQGAQESLTRVAATDAVEGFLALTLYQDRNGELDLALETVTRGLERHPKQPALLEAQGQLLLRMDRVEQALKVFRSLADVRAERGLPLLVATLVGKNRHPEAVKLAQEQIDQHGNAASGYLLLSAVYRQQKDYSKAESALEKGLKSVKDDLLLQMKLAELYVIQQKFEKALHLYVEQRGKHPGSMPLAFSLGSLYDQLGDKRKALELYRLCLEGNDDYVPALNNLAFLLADNYRDLDEALQLAVRAFRFKPAEPGIMDTLGYVLTRKGRFADALPYLEKSAAMLPADSTVQLHLAMAYQGLGKNVEAKAMANKVVASGNPALVQSAETLLQQLNKAAGGKD
jgi:putative PEP-CTERM system TPR-repeat lipoprotein